MRYYKTWQEAFMDFIARYGHNYCDSYNLASEFEQQVSRNAKGIWYLYLGNSK